MLLCFLKGSSKYISPRLEIPFFLLLGVVFPITQPSGSVRLFIDTSLNCLITVFLAQPDHTNALFAVDGADRPVGAVFIEVHDIALIGQNAFELLEAHSMINSIVDRLPHEIELGRLAVLLRKVNASGCLALRILDDRQTVFRT